MYNSRDYHLRQTAFALYQLADAVEHSGLDAGDIGQMLCTAHQQSSLELTPEARRELFELQSSRATAAQFAAGLRRQADFLQAKATVHSGTGLSPECHRRDAGSTVRSSNVHP